MVEQTNSLQSVLDFVAALRSAKLFFHIECHRDEAIMIRVDVPGERWEVEFFADGNMEVERFVSSGGVTGGVEAQRLLRDLFEQNRD